MLEAGLHVLIAYFTEQGRHELITRHQTSQKQRCEAYTNCHSVRELSYQLKGEVILLLFRAHVASVTLLFLSQAALPLACILPRCCREILILHRSHR